MAKKAVSGAVVREWANSEAGAAALAEADLTVGTRGRFDAKVIDLFQKSTGQRYEVGIKPVRKVTAQKVNANGRKVTVTRNVNPAEARAWALAEGLVTSTKGRLPQPVLQAYAASR